MHAVGMPWDLNPGSTVGGVGCAVRHATTRADRTRNHLALGGRNLELSPDATLTMVTLNSPDPPALARFYARLLGWKIETESPGWTTLRNRTVGIRLGFHIEDVYQRPVWPSQPGEQIMQMHLEIRVVDLAAG
jgi:hypothetical protein